MKKVFVGNPGRLLSPRLAAFRPSGAVSLSASVSRGRASTPAAPSIHLIPHFLVSFKDTRKRAAKNKTHERNMNISQHANNKTRGAESRTTLIQESSAAAAGTLEDDEDEELEESPPSETSASLSCFSTTAFSEGKQSRQRRLKACSSGTLWP